MSYPTVIPNQVWSWEATPSLLHSARGRYLTYYVLVTEAIDADLFKGQPFLYNATTNIWYIEPAQMVYNKGVFFDSISGVVPKEVTDRKIIIQLKMMIL